MISLIENLPDNLIGFKASGQVTSADFTEVMIPSIEKILSKQKKIRLLYQFDDSFMGFEAGALWQDAKLGLSHLSAWERTALIMPEHHMADNVPSVQPSAVQPSKNQLSKGSPSSQQAQTEPTDWIRTAVEVFGFAIPGQIRIFSAHVTENDSEKISKEVSETETINEGSIKKHGIEKNDTEKHGFKNQAVEAGNSESTVMRDDVHQAIKWLNAA